MQVLMSSWLGALPVVMAAAAVLFVPGGVIAWAAGARGYRLWALAAPITFTIAGVGAILLALVGLPFNVASFAVLAALAAGAAYGVRVWSGKLRGVGAHPFDTREVPDASPGRMLRVTAPLAIALAATLSGARLVSGIGAPTEIAQLFDNIFHLNATAIIHRSGVGSSLTLGNLTQESAGFYPAAFHDVAALVMGRGVDDVAIALNAVSLLLACVVWPLSLTFLTTRLFGTRPDVLILTAVVATSMAAFPYRLFSFGVLYPFLAGMTMIPVVIGLVVELFGRSAAARTSLAGIFLSLAAIGPGIALTHPSVVIAATVFAAPFAIDALARGAGRRPDRTWILIVAGAYLAVTLALFLLVRPPLDTAPWDPSQDYRQAIGAIVTVSPGGAAVAWPIFGLALLGAVAAARRPTRLWPIAAMFAVAGAIYFGSAAVTQPALRDFLAGVWYRDTERAGALLVLAASPLVVLGACTGARVLQVWTGRVTARIPQRTAGLVATVVTAGALVASSFFGPIPQAQEWVRQSFGHDGQALLSDDERALLQRVPDLVPADGVIVGDPLTGASLTPAYADRMAIAPHVYGKRSDAETYLLLHWDEAGADPEVCPLVRKLDAYWAIDFGTNGVYRGQVSSLPGTESVAAIGGPPGSDSAVTEIARVGDAALYEATACMPRG
jgi:hypothetical protein